MRLVPVKKPGVVLQGTSKLIIDNRPVALLLHWTGAGGVLTVSNKVWVDNKPIGVAPGKCTEGISIKGSSKVILG